MTSKGLFQPKLFYDSVNIAIETHVWEMKREIWCTL